VKVGTTESEIKNGTLLIEVEARLRDDDVAAGLPSMECDPTVTP
jgi:hypothetical protein